jgi:hypothetical protein
MVKSIFRSEMYRYSDLEAKLVEDFKFQNHFLQGGPVDEIFEFKKEIYWVFKYLKMIRFIQDGPDGPDGLICISS